MQKYLNIMLSMLREIWKSLALYKLELPLNVIYIVVLCYLCREISICPSFTERLGHSKRFLSLENVLQTLDRMDRSFL